MSSSHPSRGLINTIHPLQRSDGRGIKGGGLLLLAGTEQYCKKGFLYSKDLCQLELKKTHTLTLSQGEG